MAAGSQPEKSKHRQIADDLRAAIAAGEYTPGDKLPSETELMQQYGVARGTVREAFAILQAEWLTEARRGSGIYVRTLKPIKRNSAERLARKNWGAGRAIWETDSGDRSHSEIVAVEEVEAPRDIAAGFGMAQGGRVWRRRLYHEIEGRVIQQSTSYLPADLVGDSPDRLRDAGLWATFVMLKELGHAPVKVREEVRTRPPLADETESLKVTLGTPVILIAQTAFDANGRPVEITELVLDSGSYLLEYEFTV